VRAGKRTRAELDLGTLRDMLAELDVDHVFIELVAARPGQGTVSMFRFGFCTGAIIGLVAGLQRPYSLLLPQRWQKLAGWDQRLTRNGMPPCRCHRDRAEWPDDTVRLSRWSHNERGKPTLDVAERAAGASLCGQVARQVIHRDGNAPPNGT
jgi:hypothetical protein